MTALRRHALALALTTVLVPATVAPAQAGPAIAAVAAFAATPLGGFVVSIGASLAFTFVGNLIRQATRPPAQSPRAALPQGVRGTVEGGEDVPIGFPLGPCATAGSLAYHGRWGEAEGTPNAYHVEERIISDLPLTTITGMWLNDQRVTWGGEPVEQGYPILELRRDGVDYGWILFDDGTQTALNAYMRAKFGSHPTRPYEADMIGRGQAKVIVTLRVNRALMKTLPKMLFECPSIPLYDITLDSTRGGDGPQRQDDPGTWEPSVYLPVLIYNVLMGIRYGSEWVYGMQDASPAGLPAASWIAAIAEAKTAVAKAGGGTEPQWAGGMYVTGDMEPQAVLKELLKGCSGRMAEIGGIYKMICGLPASPVYSFTDDDVLVTRGRGFRPWPVLGETVNGIASSYYEPEARWRVRAAPLRRIANHETADLGKELIARVRYEPVHSQTQVQRLDNAALLDARRFRRHSLYLPPEASELEPLDMVAWTSAEAGYTAKKFLVSEVLDEPTYIDLFHLQEVDPGDHDYSAEEDEQPFTVGTLAPSNIPPQLMVGWSAEAETMADPDGNGWWPTFRVRFAGGLDDVRAVRIQVRESWGDKLLVFDGESNYDPAVPLPSVLLQAAFARKRTYELRGKLLPFSSRETRWSNYDAEEEDGEGEWISVTTDNVPMVPPGSIDPESLAQETLNKVRVAAETVAQVLDMAERLGDLEETVLAHEIGLRENTRQLALVQDEHGAFVRRTERVQVTQSGVLAQIVDQVGAMANGIFLDGALKMVNEINGTTGVSTISIYTRATNGEYAAEAAQIWGAEVTEEGARSFIGLIADDIYMLSTAGEFVSQPFAIELFNDLPAVTITNLRFGYLASIAEAESGDPIYELEGETGAESVIISEDE